MRFNLVQLRAFVAAAESLSFTAAAERVHVSQPTFSATIRNLEEEIGTRLFERSSRMVQLTQVGREFLPHALRVLGDVGRAANLMSDLVSVRRGSVRFSALPVLYSCYLQDALMRYRHDWPGVRFELFDHASAEAIELLRQEQLDLAVISDPDPDRELICDDLCDRSMVAVMLPDHPLAGDSHIEWRRLLDGQTALVLGGGRLGVYVEEQLVAAGITVQADYRAQHLHMALGIITSGLAVGIMTNISASAMAHEDVVIRDLVNPTIVRPLSLARSAYREMSPAAEKFRQTVLAHWGGSGAARGHASGHG